MTTIASQSFVYRWDRVNGEHYIGVHKGTPDDGYIGSGKVFKMKYHGSNKSEWVRRIFFTGTSEDCFALEAELVQQTQVDDPLCLNQCLGGLGGVGNLSGEDHPMFGKTHTTEARAKMSASLKGREVWNKGLKGAQVGPRKGVKLSDETKQRISTSKKGAPYRARPKVTCPHCNKVGGAEAMSRWHFNNCKERNA